MGFSVDRENLDLIPNKSEASRSRGRGANHGGALNKGGDETAL